MRNTILSSIFLLLLVSCSSGQQRSANALINESSPYLLQHAYNPVDWHPWGEAALEKAERENKLLIISVGYAACHWCHVMEHESFEDTAVARIMNEHFVAVKVDREERPDIDNIYMTACQLAGEGSCGWPLNAFALPNGQPVYAGTYFPKRQWVATLEYFAGLYREQPEKLQEYAALLSDGIQTVDAPQPFAERQPLQPGLLDTAAARIHGLSDRQYGGMQGAPKFPLPSVYQFLLQHHYLSGDTASLQITTEMLDAMAAGGIYDQLGGGFARYATDNRWQLPHFEKMLYDNAQLISLYSQAFKLTGRQRYREIIAESLDFIAREMSSPAGGFYSSLDADSGGEEGRYYTWTATEVDSLLPEKQVEIFKGWYQIDTTGELEGRNVLYQSQNAGKILTEYKLDSSEFRQILQESKQQLWQARQARERPGLDDKQLTSWNALMISAYAHAFQATREPDYRKRAQQAGQFLRKHLLQPAEDGQYRLQRSYKDGEAYINGFLDDYAFSIQALLDLYNITFAESWLELADGLTRYTLQQFSADGSPLFYYTSAEGEALIARQAKVEDNVIPSANSALARALLQLGTYRYDSTYTARAEAMMQAVLPQLRETDAPTYFANWLQLHGELSYPMHEVAIVGPDYDKKRAELQKHYLPDAYFLGGADEGGLELLKGKLQGEDTYLYVCQNRVCQLPVQEARLALQQLKN